MGSSANPSHKEGVNVQVLLRCRPATDEENRSPHVVQCSEARREVTVTQNVAGRALDRKYTFDKVFGPASTQETVFKNAVIPIIDEVLEGFNCTIFAYGQTGTGKTYTMEGGAGKYVVQGGKLSPSAGVIPRAIKRIFEVLKSSDSDHNVRVSFLELYNEELTDLWGGNEESKGTRLKLMEDKSGGVNVNGLEECIVENAAQIQEILERGSAKRRTAETNLNKQSSRSHSIFSVTIRMKDHNKEGEDVFKTGKLNLVDLAGSEDISRSGANQERAREAGSINQSLLTLGRVINALVNNSSHIPYRDSKLTRLLRDSLGGKTKTCIIATVAPTVQCQEETLSTLDYAHRAKNIKNKPEVNQRISQTGYIRELHIQVQKLNQELSQQRQKDGGVYVGAEQYNTLMAESAAYKSQTKDFEEVRATTDKRIEELEESLEQREKENMALEESIKETKQHLELESFVCSCHVKAENALADHSVNLTRQLSTLHEAYKAIAGLVVDSMSQANTNRVLSIDLKTGIVEKLDALKASLSQLVETGCGICDTFDQEASSFEDRCKKASSKFVDGMHKMDAMSGSLQKNCDQSLDNMLLQNGSGMEEVREFAAESLMQAKADFQLLLGKLSPVKPALIAASENLTAKLHDFFTRQVNMLQGQVESVGLIRGKVTHLKRSASVAFSGIQEQELCDIDTFAHKTREIKEEFGRRIDELMQDFTQSKRRRLEECQAHNDEIDGVGEAVLGLLEDQHTHLDSMQNSIQEKSMALENEFQGVPNLATQVGIICEESIPDATRMEEKCTALNEQTQICNATFEKVVQEGKAACCNDRALAEKAMNEVVKQIESEGDEDKAFAHRLKAVSQITTNNIQSLQQEFSEQCATLHELAAVKTESMKWDDFQSRVPEEKSAVWDDPPSTSIVNRLRAPPQENMEGLYFSGKADDVLRPTQALTGGSFGELDMDTPVHMADATKAIGSKLPKVGSRIPPNREGTPRSVKYHKNSEIPLLDGVIDGRSQHRSSSARSLECMHYVKGLLDDQHPNPKRFKGEPQ